MSRKSNFALAAAVLLAFSAAAVAPASAASSLNRWAVATSRLSVDTKHSLAAFGGRFNSTFRPGGWVADDLNPQPLPPRSFGGVSTFRPGGWVADDINPQPLPPRSLRGVGVFH